MRTNLVQTCKTSANRINLNRITMRVALIGLFVSLGIGNAWASTTYYAKVTAKVSNTGGGKVYASTSNSTPAANNYSETSSSAQGSKSDAQVTLYIFATAKDGYAFKGWSKTENKYDLGTNSPYTVNSGTSGISTSSGNYTEVGPYYATFVKIFQFKAKADLTTGSAGLGDVCVNFTNGTPAYQASAMTATTTQNGDDANTASKTKTAYFYAQKHTGAEFRGWYSDAAGTNKVSDNASYSANITSSVIAEPASPQLTYYAKFEKVETTPYWSLFGVAGTSKTLQIGETIGLVTETAGTSYSWGTPTYVDAGETNPVMTYNSSTKTFTANRAGTVTVTFTQAGGEDANGVLWKAGSQTFTFTVEKCTPTFAWADPLPNFVVGTNLSVSNLFSFTPAECEQNWTLTSSDPTNLPGITAPTAALSLPKEVNGVTLTFHQDATWKWSEIENTSITVNVTKEPVEFSWKNPALIAGNTYSWTDFVETNSAGAWNLMSENESIIPTMRSIASTSGTVAAGVVTLTFTQGPDLGHDAVPVQTKTFTVYPALATFKIGTSGSNYTNDLAYALSEASKLGSNKYVFVASDGIVVPGTYNIPSGVTLVVPYESSFQTSYITKPKEVANSTLPIEAYRTLKLVDGVTINVNSGGAISVCAQIQSGDASHNPTGFPVGPVGVIDMSTGGKINVKSGGKLYAWGFIKGEGYLDGNNTTHVGTVTAENGSTVWECFGMGDWNGGSFTYAAGRNSKSYKIFPFQSYYVQNIEVPLHIKYGAEEKLFASFYANSSTNNTSITFMSYGSNTAMFLVTENSSTSEVVKRYDPATDHMVVDLVGKSKLGSLDITISYSFISVTASSKDFDCPIVNNMHIRLINCDLSLTTPIKLFPGSVFEVTQGSRLLISTNVYVMDHDDWGKVVNKHYFGVTPKTLSPHASLGDDINDNTLPDAKIIVDGGVEISSGGIFTSPAGANVMGNGGGTFRWTGSLPSNATTNGYTLGSSVDGSTTSAKLKTDGILATTCTPAKLHNDAETANDSYTASVGSKTFYNIHGRWFVQEDKDEKSDHTYKFTYIDGSNTGATAYCIYTADKTGLMAGYKWVNVELDNTFCGSKTYRGIDGHYYFYNSASTDAVSKWVQFVKLNDVLYSGSDNNLYTFTTTGCSWASVGEIDENCMYTIDDVKKALVGTEFVELEKDEYDEVYVKVSDHSDYYMLFDGCVWQHATKIPDTYKAYEVLDNPYIWLNDEWTKVEEESPYYYITDDQSIRHYYEFDYVTFTWQPVKNKVRITSSTEGSRDFLTWDDAMLYLGQYTNPTVTLLEDAIATQSVATLAPNSKSTAFTFDLNGHTLTVNIGDKAYAIPSTNHACFMNMNTSAKLYITDNSDKGTGQMLVYGVGNKNISCLRVTKGNVVMNGGRIYMENGFKYVNNANYKYVRAAGISLAAGQTLEINDGEIEAKTHIYAYGVFAESSAATATTSKITMNGGKVTGTAASSAYGILSYGIINMNGGTVEGKTEKVTTAASGTTDAGSTAYGIYAHVSSNGTASNCYYATVNMTGGVVNATAATSTAYGIYAHATQTIASSVSNYNPATNKASAKLNITGGEINAKCLTSTTAYGVYAIGTANSNGSNASGAHIIKNCKITASATGTAYGVIMSASVHDLSGIALTADAEIENVDIYAETTSASTAAAVVANATNAFMSRAKYNNGTSGVSADNKKLWFIDANNNDGDLTHEAIAVSGTDAKKTYRCKIGATGAGAHITIKSGNFRAKSAYQYAYGAYAVRSICNYDGTKGNGEITILDGTFSAETAAEYAWSLRNDGVMNVQGGTFNALAGTSTAYGVYTDAGVTTINGGTFNIDATTTTAYGVCATSVIEGNTGWKYRGEIIINGGTFNAHALGTTYAAGVYATGTYVELNQTKYDARSADNKKLYYPVDEEGNKLANATTANYYPYRFGVHTIGGKVTVNGGTFNAKAFTTTAWGAYVNMSSAVRTDMIDRQGVARGEITIHDGEFNVETETSTTAEGIRSYGTVYVDGGTFNIKSKKETAYGLYVMDGTTTVDGGTFNIYAGTNTAVGLRSHVYANNDYGYYVGGEAIINGGTFNVNTWGGNAAYGVYVTGAAGAFAAGKSTGYTGEKPSNYAVAGRATVKGGTFVVNPSTGVDAYGFFLEPNKVSGTATAYPKCEVNGGFFQMKGTGVYAANAQATEDAEGNPNLWVKGGHFSNKTNLEQASPKNYVRAPHHVLNCVHPEYKATYPYEVAEAYTITFKDDEDNTLWSGLQPKGSTAVYPLTNGIPEKAATATNSFEFASWNTPLATITADATYIASFNTVAKKFMVTWKDDAGNEIDHMEYASGATPTHADPVKDGYTFTGWTPAITAVGAADQIYTATFSINQYTIRWENEDGTLIREDKVNYNVTPTKPSNPTKEGYSFQAWNPGVVKATEDVTYTATYMLNLVTLTKSGGSPVPYVTFALALTEANKADGGTLTLLQDVNVGGAAQSFTRTTTLDLNGHTLRGAVNKLINVNGSGKTVTVKDSKGGGMIDNTLATNGQLTAVYVTKGTFVLEGGTIHVENPTTTSSASYYAAAVYVPASYSFRMDGGLLESVVNVDYAYGVFNLGTATLNHGTINTYAPSRSYGVRAGSTTTINNDVTINANATRTTYGVAVWSNVADKTITINGGTFNGIATTTTGYAIEATAAATINVNGGKFKSTTKTVSNTGSATIHLNGGFYDTDTELAGLASPKQVVALTTEPEKAEGYNYKIVDDAHQITFKNEDGSVVLQQSNIEDGVQPVYSGVAQTKASTPKYAYDFYGWKDASDDHVYAADELPTVSEDVVYLAYFARRGVEYPITFSNIDGMGTNYVQMVAYDEVPEYDGPTPYMSGAVSNYAYTFIGWDPELAAVAGPATYTPRYDLVISHNVSFVINNPSATTPTTFTVAEDAAVERPADQLVNCEHIAGWYKDNDFDEEWDFANDKMGDHDIILYAKWETKTYTITWLDENADEIDQTTVNCGTVPSHADLYKPSTAACSYEWRGWNKTLVAANANATYKSLGFTQVPKRYAITFVTGAGATVINPIELEVGSIVVAPADPSREGYTFTSWAPEVPSEMPARNLECVAQWTPNTNTAYTVKHYQQNLDGTYPDEPTETDIETGTTDTEVTPAVKDYTGFTAPSAQTVTISADGSRVVTYQYTRNSYNLTWNSNGGELSGSYTSGLVLFGTTITAPTANRANYDFDGWDEEPAATMPAEDKTYTAQWSLSAVTILWKSEDGETTLETDEGVEIDATPSFNGETPTKITTAEYTYTFDGWTTEANGAGTFYAIGELPTVSAAATYYAHFTATANVASVTVGGATTYYTDFAEAWDATNSATGTVTLKLLQDVSGVTTSLAYTNAQNCTLDLNNHTILGSVSDRLLEINAAGKTFTIDDGSAEKGGRLENSKAGKARYYAVYLSAGILNLEHGTIHSSNPSDATYSTLTSNAKKCIATGVYVDASQTFNMNGGEVSASAIYLPIGIQSAGYVNVKGGLVAATATKFSTAYGIYAGSTTKIYDGTTITAISTNSTSTYGIYIAAGTTTLYGGKIESYATSASGTTAIGVYAYKGNLSVPESSTVDVIAKSYGKTCYGVQVAASRTATIKAGSYAATSTKASTASGVYSLGTTTISGGTFTISTKTTNAYGVYATRGKITVNGSPIFNVTAGSTTAYGAFAYGTVGANGKSKYSGTIEINGGTFNVTTTTTTAYGAYAGLYSRTVNLVIPENAADTIAGQHYMPGILVVNDGTFNVKATTTGAFGIVVAKAKSESGTVGTTARIPLGTVTGGKFKVESMGDANATAYAMNSATTAARLVVQGGYYNTKRTDASETSNIEDKYTAPEKDCNYHVLDLPEEELPYKYKVAEAYNLTWDAAGGELSGLYTSGYTAVGDPITVPTATRTDYDFSGWNESPAATMPASDKTYTATWTLAETGDYVDIVDWTSNGDGTGTLTINANGWTASGWPYTINGTSYEKGDRATDRTLTIPYSGAAGTQLQIRVEDKDESVVSLHKYQIPFIGTTEGADAEDIVYVNSGTLTISTNTTLGGLYVRPEASVEVESGKLLTVGKLVMRTLPWQAAAISGDFEAEEVWYTRIAPNKRTISGPDGEITYESASYYQFALPLSSTVALKDIKVSHGANTPYGSTWLLKYYSEESRAANGAGSDNWEALVENETIQGGVGYEMFSNSNYYREFYFPLGAVSSASLGTTTAVRYDLGAAGEKHAGWNIVASPLMSVYDNSGADPETGMKVSRLLTDGSYDQGIPEYIYPAIPFSYQATENQTCISFEGSSIVAAAPQRRVAAEDESVRKQWIHLDVQDGNGIGDHTSILSHPTRYEDAYKTGIDVAKQSLTASRAIIYSSHAYGDMAFAGVADTLLEQGVALTVYSPIAQELTISMRENNWLGRMEYVWLVDHETGVSTDLLWDTYTFDATEGTTRGRFTIEGIFRTPQITTDIENGEVMNGEMMKVRKVLINQKMYIIRGDQMYDATGKKVSK